MMKSKHPEKRKQRMKSLIELLTKCRNKRITYLVLVVLLISFVSAFVLFPLSVFADTVGIFEEIDTCIDGVVTSYDGLIEVIEETASDNSVEGLKRDFDAFAFYVGDNLQTREEREKQTELLTDIRDLLKGLSSISTNGISCNNLQSSVSENIPKTVSNDIVKEEKSVISDNEVSKNTISANCYYQPELTHY